MERLIELLQEIKETLSEQMMIILLIAAGISLLIKEYHDAVGICFAILLSTTIGILTESRSKKAAEALNRMTEDISVKVLRDGEKQDANLDDASEEELKELEKMEKMDKLEKDTEDCV